MDVKTHIMNCYPLLLFGFSLDIDGFVILFLQIDPFCFLVVITNIVVHYLSCVYLAVIDTHLNTLL